MSTVEQEAQMLRIHARAAEDYIAALTEFVRTVSRATTMKSYSAGYVIEERYKEEAKELVCYIDGCMDRPSGNTPDGRSFCGRHAGVMD